MHTKHVAFTFTGLLALVAGACGCNSPLPVAGEPRLIPGGGIGDGPIRGKLNVYVIDEDTRNVLSSASVRVGAADELTAVHGAHRFDRARPVRFQRRGCQPGRRRLRRRGLHAADEGGHADRVGLRPCAQHLDRRRRQNVTIALRAISSPALGRATVMGTIAGWDDMPAPAANHNRLALDRRVVEPGSDRSREQPRPGDAQRRRRCPGPAVLVRHRVERLRAQLEHRRAGQRLQLGADDAQRAAGAFRDPARSGHQGDPTTTPTTRPP